MSRLVRNAFLIALVVVVSAAGCGGGDSSSDSAKPSGTTGGTDLSSQIPDIPEMPGGTPGPPGSESSGSATANGRRSERRGGTSPRSPTRSRGGRNRSGTTPLGPGDALGGSPGSAGSPESRSAVYRLAKEICANVTLAGIRENLRINKRDPKFVATAFSRRYPERLRADAAAGCLDGFRHEVRPPP